MALDERPRAARLRRLSIRDVVLIEALDLDFAPGLNVLTGETGAGKSILLDALGLTLGAKAAPDLVRDGAARGVASALFTVPPEHPAAARLTELGLIDLADAPADGREPFELILRRVVPRDGRSRAFVNDQPVGQAALRALGAELVDIHGQGEDRAVADPRGRRAALDAYAGLGPELSALRARYAAWRAAAERADRAAAEADRAEADRDYLRHAEAELADLAPEPGEEARREAERRRLKTADRIAEAVGDVAAQLDAGPATLGAAARRLARAVDGPARRGGPAAPDADLADEDRAALDTALSALDRALDAQAEAAAALAAAADRFAADAEALDRAETRLFELRAMARKHRAAPDDLPGLAADLAARLAALDASAAARDQGARAAAEAETAYRAAAEALSTRRADAARAFEAAVAAELPDLRLPRARFQVTPGPDPAGPGPDGLDRVDFLAAFNPGLDAGPVERIASGGELSRLLLALKVALASAAPAAALEAAPLGPILVFDEIDRGVGGAAADAVGERLQRLADAGAALGAAPLGQAIVVTHAPQIAARAARHIRIEKTVSDGRTSTSVAALAEGERVEEIARMLSGADVADAARAAAADLLSRARSGAAPSDDAAA